MILLKLFDNKLLVGGGCIAAAALLAFWVLPGVYAKKAKTVTVCKLKQEVSAGTKIEKEMIRETEVGSFGLPDSVIKNRDEIIGKYAKESILPEDFLFPAKFSDNATDERLDKAAAEGKKLMSVSIGNTAAGVAGYLKAGDIISVVCYTDGGVQAFDELKNIEIYSVKNAEGVNVETAAEEEGGDKTAATLTLIVTDTQAQKLVLAEYSGKLHAIFEKRG